MKKWLVNFSLILLVLLTTTSPSSAITGELERMVLFTGDGNRVLAAGEYNYQFYNQDPILVGEDTSYYLLEYTEFLEVNLEEQTTLQVSFKYMLSDVQNYGHITKYSTDNAYNLTDPGDFAQETKQFNFDYLFLEDYEGEMFVTFGLLVEEKLETISSNIEITLTTTNTSISKDISFTHEPVFDTISDRPVVPGFGFVILPFLVIQVVIVKFLSDKRA